MAADGEASEVERAALDEHLEHCDDCSEWRALAEAVVLHVRTTPPSPVPEGLARCFRTPPLAASRAGGARRRTGRRSLRGRGARRRRRRLETPSTPAPTQSGVVLPHRDRRRLEHDRHARTAARCRARPARRPDFVTPLRRPPRCARDAAFPAGLGSALTRRTPRVQFVRPARADGRRALRAR